MNDKICFSPTLFFGSAITIAGILVVVSSIFVRHDWVTSRDWPVLVYLVIGILSLFVYYREKYRRKRDRRSSERYTGNDQEPHQGL